MALWIWVCRIQSWQIANGRRIVTTSILWREFFNGRRDEVPPRRGMGQGYCLYILYFLLSLYFVDKIGDNKFEFHLRESSPHPPYPSPSPTPQPPPPPQTAHYPLFCKKSHHRCCPTSPPLLLYRYFVWKSRYFEQWYPTFKVSAWFQVTIVTCFYKKYKCARLH